MNLPDAELRRFDIRSVLLGPILVLGALSGCNSGADNQAGSSSGTPVGTVVDHTDPDLGSLHFVVDRNEGGSASHPRVINLSWGRLANVYDSTGTRQQVDMVIGRDIPQVDPTNFEFEVNAVTGENSITIKNFAFGTPEYENLFRLLDANLTPIQDKSLEPNELPPYSLAPRNSAIVVRFDDLIDESTIISANLKVMTGNPPVTPFDLRVIPDVNHGDVADFTHPNPGGGDPLPGGDGIPEFHTTRIIIDTTVSELESGASNPPLPVNALGLPESPTPNLPNVAMRIPTALNASAGQLTLLVNLAGHSISFSQSGSTDSDSPTNDVVRAFRSGNSADQNRGFLFDDIPPQVVGAQAVFLGTVTEPSPGEFHAPVSFAVLGCASRLKEGDVVQQPGVFAEVVTESADPVGGQILDATLRVVSPIDGHLAPGPAQVSSIFDPVLNVTQRACFVRFPNIASPPAAEVATDSSVIVRFSEPMNPVTVKPFDSFTITRFQTTPTPTDFIIGEVIPSSDLRQFTFVPTLPFRHDNPAGAEQYFINMADGTAGPTDLAGNPVATALPQFGFTIDPDEADQNNGGFVLRFSSTDELNSGDGPEVRGQYLYDLTAGLLRPRSVSRFAAAATRDKPVPSIMRLPVNGVQTPLSPLGSKMQTIWRYCDVGFGLQDESFFNVDIEGLDWAPIGGSVVPDTYDRFEILLSHCLKLPDETVNPLSLLPLYPLSGLVTIFNSNVLDPVNDPQKVVHHRALGYVVDPAERFLSTTTPVVTMMPYPLNRSLPPNQHTFYTWRDTALQALGCPNQPQGGPGAELAIVVQVLNLSVLPGTPYAKGFVPTIALPLLMEFRCFPDSEALGLNSFDINIAINSSSLPNFRAFSTGGNNSSGVPVPRDPDLQPTALGGFNPNSNPPGLPTIPVDNVFYIGQMDLVIRISRAHTIWFNSQSASPIFSPPVIEPRAADQPSGSAIQLAFRGATIVTGNIALTAAVLTPYGESPDAASGTVTFLNNDTKWKDSIDQIQGARFFQTRITFLSNADTSLTPTLSALGFAFRL